MLALFRTACTRRSVKIWFCLLPSRRLEYSCAGVRAAVNILSKEREDETNPQMDVGAWRGCTGRRAPSCLASANAWRGIL